MILPISVAGVELLVPVTQAPEENDMFKYEPTEMFIQGIDQSSVDDSTEHWLDRIEEAIKYKAWFCGHWHVNKRIDKMHFLFHSVESIEQFMENVNDEN